MRNVYKRLNPKSLLSAVAVFLFVATQSMQAQPDGEKLFKANCAACHKPDKDLVGPALQGVTEKYAGKEEILYLWIKNPQKALESGDPVVKATYDEWSPRAGMMPPQAVTDEEIVAILDYIENYAPEAPAVDTSGGGTVTYVVNEDSQIWIVIATVLLLVATLALRTVIIDLKNASRWQSGKETVQEESVGESISKWVGKNRLLTVFMALFVGVLLLLSSWDALFNIGVYTGYQPEQPINYSHQVHAGKLEIECVYCHTGTLKSKSAMIPSANVCMNCHRAVAEGTETGTEEIQKIYDAVGWDGTAYTGETHPIEWVRVHNLPDHVYFSHQQHYVIGNVDCTECHGNMEEVGVGKQVSPLTMGWCLDCHNTRQVDIGKNGYYDEVHARLKEFGADELRKYLEDDKITVRELGGYECAKCHY
jgi:cytochrome c551/c552